MKVKISPRGALPSRRRSAKGDRTVSFKSKLPRSPDAFAGESRKIRRRLDLEKRVPLGRSLPEGTLLINLILLVCISCSGDNLSNESNYSATLNMKECASHEHFEPRTGQVFCCKTTTVLLA